MRIITLAIALVICAAANAQEPPPMAPGDLPPAPPSPVEQRVMRAVNERLGALETDNIVLRTQNAEAAAKIRRLEKEAADKAAK